MEAVDMKDVDAYVEEVWENAVSDIASLVRIPSVADADAASPGAPFGRPVREALDCALGIAERLGYRISDDDGYVGMADIPGSSDAQIATIAHVDVVPAGPGWRTDPFECQRREGWLLGRGVIDDKGPAVLSLYAGAYLLRRGVAPRYTFRALIGCDEEVGMSDVHHYLAANPQPAFLFTPDAEFPVCNAEKGCFGGTFASEPIEDGLIVSWSGAEATNAIPSESVLELALDASKLEARPEGAMHADRIDLAPAGDGRCRIVAHGIGGHASLPEGTLNAIGLVVEFLLSQPEEVLSRLAAPERAFLELLRRIHLDAAGTGLDIACSDEVFGALTCNAGTIDVRGGRIFQTVDIRFPGCADGERLESRCAEAASRFGCAFEVSRVKEPFSVSAASPAVQALLDTYRDVTGREAVPFSMGGGTYARNFERAVSFGPEDSSIALPDWAGAMHGPNEAACEAQLKEALKIYILAILRLQELDGLDGNR